MLYHRLYCKSDPRVKGSAESHWSFMTPKTLKYVSTHPLDESTQFSSIQLWQFTSARIRNLTVCEPIDKIQTERHGGKTVLLRRNSLEDLVRSTLKTFTVAQGLVVDHRLPSSRKVYRFNTKAQEDSGVPTRGLSDEKSCA